MITRTLAQPGHYEHLAHADLSDMPDTGGTNTDHDARYFTETEADARYLKLDCSNDPLIGELDQYNSTTDLTNTITTYGALDADYPRLHLRHSQTDTPLSKSATSSDCYLGYIGFYGVNSGSDFTYGSRIYSRQVGAAGAGLLDADLWFNSYNIKNQLFDNAGVCKWIVYDSDATEVFSVNSDGDLFIPTGAGDGYLLSSDATGNASWLKTEYQTTFTNSDLTAGVLTVTHALNSEMCDVTIYDNANKQIVPDDITSVDANNISVDLSSYGVIAGTWTVIVIATSGSGSAISPIILLASITGIDAKVVTATTLYTVPAGKQAIITDIFIRCTEATDITVDCDGTIGANATDYDDFIISGISQNMFLENDFNATARLASLSGPPSIVYQAGDVIKLNITTGATGTSQTFAVDVWGYLI